MASAKKQTNMMSFFNKTPKGPKTAPDAKGDISSTPSTPSTPTTQSKLAPGTLVWAKLSGYPWWPSMICNHPTEGRAVRRKEVHVQFFDDPVTRAWVDQGLVKQWDQTPQPGPGVDGSWDQGVQQAKDVVKLTKEERLEAVLVPLLPSDDDEESFIDEKEVSPGSKENKQPEKKRRRIMMPLDSDDSDGDEDFKPSKDDLKEAKKAEEECSSGDSEEDMEGESEPDSSPIKGKKRKMETKNSAAVPKKSKVTPGSSLLSTPVGKFASGLARSNSPALSSPGPLPGVCDSTKKKLSAFSAGGLGEGQEGVAQGQQYAHTKLSFLQPANIKDADRRPPSHPDYNPRTLYVPQDFLAKQTPGQRQWWELKSQYYDVVLFFKMGKFYEFYHMDADIGVSELNLVYMRGETAHAGFPEVAYSKWATALLEKGYKVARIEQTETPIMMDERVKNMCKPTKFDKVVKREVCQLASKGTRVNNFMDPNNFEGDPSYLLALLEKPGPEFGVAFIDTTIGVFHLAQFKDDKSLSRLRTMIAHHPPVELLYARGNLTDATYSFISASLSGVRKEVLKLGTEFWEATKTLKVLAEGEFFKGGAEDSFSWPEPISRLLDPSDSLGLSSRPEGELAISSLGALVWYLAKGYLDQQLLSQKKFEFYNPIDFGRQAEIPSLSDGMNKLKGPAGKHMVLDGVTVNNLELLANNTTGGQEGTLLGRLDTCSSAMGKRTLRHWLTSPLLSVVGIRARQAAVGDLIGFTRLQDVKDTLRKLPDLERLLSKVHAAGDVVKSKNHPDSRAIFFENDKYSKRKILDLLSCLDGFKRCGTLLDIFSGQEFVSKMLRNVTSLETDGGQFPDLVNLLQYFDNAFDHESARKEGKIVPSPGVDTDLDEANRALQTIDKEGKEYLKEQRRVFGCEVKYWGTGKNRFQLEVPIEKVNKATSDYELASGTKKLKRYVTMETRELLERQIAAEEQRERALGDIQRKMFAQFSNHADTWRKAIGCLSLLDALVSLAVYSSGLETSCFPTLLEEGETEWPVLEVVEGRHPSLDMVESTFIPNDTSVGGGKGASTLIILTGPNMGGKSTLMRQTGLLAILAQIGAQVPAQEMRLSPVDRVFTRLGASDNIVGGESTFFVELQETGTILAHATPHSLILIDELGRGTATYDGTAIAGSVASWLAGQTRARTLFSTHYHCLATEERVGVRAAHMACMVENEDHEDISQQDITFLYKLTEGAAPKSHGFNAAKLAGLPGDIIRNGYAKAKAFELSEKKKEIFQDIFSVSSEAEDIGDLVKKIASL